MPVNGVPTPSAWAFTFWGGILGPWMLTHVRCNECGTCYNGNTGKSNNAAIAIYLGVSLAIGVIIGACGIISAVLNHH